jgi:hypothetical protein
VKVKYGLIFLLCFSQVKIMRREENPDAEVGTRARLDITPAELQFTTETAQENPELKPIAFYGLFKAKLSAAASAFLQVSAKFGAVKRTNKK